MACNGPLIDNTDPQPEPTTGPADDDDDDEDESTTGDEAVESSSGGEVVDGTTGEASTGAGSSSGGPEPFCGDGEIDRELGEECDDADLNSDTAACTSECAAAFCGDGFIWEGEEECDDANDVNTDGCTTSCIVLKSCGDGEVQEPEECDLGDKNDDNGECKTDCSDAVCGDDVIWTGEEECDDANEDNNDGCTTLCLFPFCGDGFAQSINEELCDDGDDEEGDECNNDCFSAGLWTLGYNGFDDNNDEIFDVAIDGTGDVIAVGSTFEGAEQLNVWVRKYSADGSVEWTRTYHNLTGDEAFGVAVQSDNDIYVTGATVTNNDGRDVWVRRYTPTGGEGFIVTANGSDDSTDEGRSIAIDASQDFVVAGFTTNSGSGQDVWLRRYSSGGTPEWTRTASSGGDSNDQGHGVAVDGNGNVIVTGYLWAGGEARNIWTRKYNGSGDQIWTRTHDGPGGGNDEGNDVATDSGNNVIVVGYEDSGANENDVWIRKYAPNGDVEWTVTHDAPQHGNDVGNSVAIDADDNIIVGGRIFRGPQDDNVWVAKYDSDGNELWMSEYNNSDSFLSEAINGVAVDQGSGNIAAGGYELRSDIGEARNAWIRYILQ